VSRIVTLTPTGCCGLAGLLDFRGGQVSHQEKQQCVRRDMQVEIDEAVDEKTRASQETGELQGSSERMIELPETLQRLDQEDAEKPGATDATEETRLGQDF